MSEPRFRLKPGQGLVEIVTGDRFEIINLANLETVGGNVTHLPAIRWQAIEFAMVEMLATDDEALDETLEARGYDPDTGDLLAVTTLADADLEAALDAAEPATMWRAELAFELHQRFIEASRAIHGAAFPPIATYEKLSGEVIPAHAEDWKGGAR